MAMALKRKKLLISEKVKTIQEVEKNPTLSRNEIAKHSGLPLLSLSNTVQWKASVLEEESRRGGTFLETKKHENFAK
jgi:hypothetical protein